jgi:RNA polymerase sigma-70 factor (ECF subfamily)
MSFRDLYDEHFRFVWRALRRLGVPERDTPDAVQEVFLIVHRRVAEFEGRSKLATWIFSICMRVAASRRRAAHVRREIPTEVDAGASEVADLGADASARAELQEGLSLLEMILDKLPLEQRAVFVLFELEQMPGEQVAELLDIPIGTVHSRLRLARESVHERIERVRARDQFRLQVREA